MEDVNFIEILRKYANNKCRNMYDMCICLGINKIGGETYREIRKIAKENNIELVFNKKLKKYCPKNNISLKELLVDGSDITSNRLKKKLIEGGIKEAKCECCNNTEWMGKPIPLELHHINGIHNDNRLENLQLLCRNCHGQTENFCGKNNKQKRKLRNKTNSNSNLIDKDYLIELLYINTIKDTAKELDINFYRLKDWLKKNNIKVTNKWKDELCKSYPNKFGICKNCGRRFIKKHVKQLFCSQECSKISSIKVKVTKETLISALKINGSFVKTGKFFGVSDKCISKWCLKFGIPNKKVDMKKYIMEY